MVLNHIYNFDSTWVSHAMETVGGHSCVSDRNITRYHRGLVHDDGSFLESNLKAAVIGYLGEVAYCLHYGLPLDQNEGYSATGDGGYDFTLDGFRVDVKTRATILSGSPDDIAGYIRSVMATGKEIDICKADAYFFACLNQAPSLDLVSVRLLGGVETLDVVKMPDTVSPINRCQHKNKVVRVRDLRIFSVKDFWDDHRVDEC